MKKHPHKVDKAISNAVYLYILHKAEWFIEIEDTITHTVTRFPNLRKLVVKFWLGRCDELRAKKVKEMIVERFSVDH